jgi:hypothetical protein
VASGLPVYPDVPLPLLVGVRPRPLVPAQAVVGGTASSGVIICVLRIVTKAALPPTRAGLRSSTALYFALSGLLSLACFVVYHSVLPRLGVVQHYRQKRLEGGVRRGVTSPVAAPGPCTGHVYWCCPEACVSEFLSRRQQHVLTILQRALRCRCVT